MTGTKRVRPPAESGIPPALSAIKPTNPALYAWRLHAHVLRLPAHPAAPGWWCTHPLVMAELLTFLAEPPETVEQTDAWLAFREACARQLAACHACAREYHKAAAKWEVDVTCSTTVSQIVAHRLIRGLVAWDVKRLLPRLRKSPLLARGALGEKVFLSEAKLAEKVCRDAFLECLLNFRVCMRAKVAETMAELFKRGTVVQTKEDVKPMVVEMGVVPSGLMALCFNQSFTVRAWAKRIIADVCPFPERADAHARSFLLRKGISACLGNAKGTGKGDCSPRARAEARKAAWEGFGAIFVHLRRKEILSFVRSVPDGGVLEMCLKAVNDNDDATASIAIDCALNMLTRLHPSELEPSKPLTETVLLDGVVNSFHAKDSVKTKTKLLYLMPLLLATSPQPETNREISRLFWLCFGIIEKTYEPHGHRRYGRNLLSAEPLPDNKLQTAALRAGASLLTWYFPTTVCNGTVSESDAFGQFAITVLHTEPQAAWAWNLIRTLCFTDVLSLLQWVLPRADMNDIRAISQTRWPQTAALQEEEATSMKKIIEASNSNERVVSWVGPLWLAWESGTLANAIPDCQRDIVQSEEAKLLMDLHQMVGLVDPASCLRGSGKELGPAKVSGLFAEDYLRNLELSCERIGRIQRIIRLRFCKACATEGNQLWWSQLPFHASHLLGSANREIGNSGISVLLKYRRLAGATSVVTRPTLLAVDLKSDAGLGNDVADGCLVAIRIVSALGKRTSVRTYATLLTWYGTLMDSDYPKLLEHENWKWVLGVTRTFLRCWKEFEDNTNRVIFNEVVCKFLTCLRNIWKTLSNIENDSEDELNEEKQNARQTVLDGIWTGLFSMDTLRSVICRGAWTRTVCALAPYWKDIRRLRDKMVLIIEYHESQRNLLSYEECKSIAEESELKEVNRPLQRWAADGKRMSQDAYGGKKLQMKMDQYSQKLVSKDGKIASRLVERKAPQPSLSQSRLSMPKSSKQFSGSHIAFKAMGAPSVLNNLRRGVQKSLSRQIPKRYTRPNVSAPAVIGGKTKFELLVLQERAKKTGRNNMTDRRGEMARIESERNIADGSRKEREGTPIIEPSGNLASEEKRKDIRLPQWRRRLNPRIKERLYQSILQGCSGDAIQRSEFVKSAATTFDHFEDVETYVSHWEPIITTELRASLRSIIAEEAGFAAKQSPDEYRGCRAAFMVEGPVESVGYIQNFSLRYCGEVKTQQVSFERGISDSQFDAMKMQPWDIVLLRIPPSKYNLQAEPSSVARNVLGIVVKVTRNPGIFQVKLNVAFDRIDTAPGKGREIMISKLTSMTTFHRQLDALYGLPDLSDVVLWNILEPQRSLEIKHNFNEHRLLSVGDDVQSRLDFIRQLRSSNTLNESQSLATEDVIHACAPIFAPKANRLLSQGGAHRHGSLTLIQGPPGTGKTSTIIGLLSAVLFQKDKGRSWGRHRVRFEDGVITMPLAPIRVLICAPSNAAVDEIMYRLMEDGLHTGAGCKASPRMVRIGGGTTRDSIKQLELRAIADEHLAKNMKDSTAGSARALCSGIRTLQAKIKTLEEKMSNCQESGESGAAVPQSETASKELIEMKSKISTMRDQLARETMSGVRPAQRGSGPNDIPSRNAKILKAMSTVLNSSSVMFATLSSAGHEVMQNFAAKPDLIIIDEAAQCGEPEALIPLTASQAKGAAHVVFVGDPKQLPATVISTDQKVAKALQRSLFERIGEACPLAVHMLNTQYRMHPAIAAFPNQRFYDNRLLNGSNVTSADMSPAHHGDIQKRFGPCTFLDTSHARAEESRGSKGSLYNIREASAVVSALAALYRGYDGAKLVGQIGILSPYRQQVSLLNRLISQDPVLRAAAIEVSTIDGIQGREKPIIFISTVRSGRTKTIGFVDDDRRMNVAITRAKHTLVVVGNATVLEQHSGLWASFISYCRSESRLSVLPSNSQAFFADVRPPTSNKEALSSSSTAPCQEDSRPVKRRKVERPRQDRKRDIPSSKSDQTSSIPEGIGKNANPQKTIVSESQTRQRVLQVSRDSAITHPVSVRPIDKKGKTRTQQRKKCVSFSIPSNSDANRGKGAESQANETTQQEINQVKPKKVQLRSCPVVDVGKGLMAAVSSEKGVSSDGRKDHSADKKRTDLVSQTDMRHTKRSQFESMQMDSLRPLPNRSTCEMPPHRDELKKPSRIRESGPGQYAFCENVSGSRSKASNLPQKERREVGVAHPQNIAKHIREGRNAKIPQEVSLPDYQKLQSNCNSTRNHSPSAVTSRHGDRSRIAAPSSTSVISRLGNRGRSEDSNVDQLVQKQKVPVRMKSNSIFERLGQRMHATHPFELPKESARHAVSKDSEINSLKANRHKVGARCHERPIHHGRPMIEKKGTHAARGVSDDRLNHEVDRGGSTRLRASARGYILQNQDTALRSSSAQPPTYPFSAESTRGEKRRREEKAGQHENWARGGATSWKNEAGLTDVRRHWANGTTRPQRELRWEKGSSETHRRTERHQNYARERGFNDPEEHILRRRDRHEPPRRREDVLHRDDRISNAKRANGYGRPSNILEHEHFHAGIGNRKDGPRHDEPSGRGYYGEDPFLRRHAMPNRTGHRRR
ncbi:unnamed protein product [Chondrus crispus]|uniref:Uncharacterized protein n=1 Tax=Chondrus crispus TaxID=2769 RepID=R7Q4K9_CHOCR|nr:unnamed protein product [Chondrus crispus]CDF32944.1 unnamed protein product [Chondrus crispus]|eukprot:XP_005712747.1 unnamed protein product [Chondrus crispus]